MQLLRSTLILSLVLVACSSDLLAQPAAKFAPVKPAGDPATFGANIQRTMTLLATSTPEKRNRVRIRQIKVPGTLNPVQIVRQLIDSACSPKCEGHHAAPTRRR